MNENVVKLWNEAAQYAAAFPSDSWETQVQFLERFAYLIVLESCTVLEQTEDALDTQKWPTPRGCAEYIKDYFEVQDVR